MDTFLIKAAQLILAFAILVIIHEFGHFLFARIFGVRVEKFYIFFNPWTSLFKWKPGKYHGFFGKKKLHKGVTEEEASDNPPEEPNAEDKKKRGSFWKDTEYGIGWLPLGGYCKISGMIDESMDKEQMKQPPKPWEFRTKPAWQRLLIMIAGVLFNFLLAILIYAGLVYATGEKYVPLHEAKLGMAYSEAAHQVGFKDGDIPLTADGKILENPVEARLDIIEAKNVQVLRDNDTVNIAIPKDFIFRLDEESKKGDSNISLFAYRFPTRIIQVVPGEGAHKAGIMEGDEIIGIDSVSTPSIDLFQEELARHKSETVAMKVVRKSEGKAVADTLSIPVALSDNAKMGVGLEVDPSKFFVTRDIHYNIFQSVPRGIELGVDKLTSYASSMKHVFTKEGAQSVGGFGAIGSIFPEKWDWIAFWNIAAFLSVALAFMNILPIPALDGGHVLFLLYEVITGRKPSEKFMEWAQMIGMGLLLLLLLYANGMDIVRFFMK